jgi:hypothetical protein
LTTMVKDVLLQKSSVCRIEKSQTPKLKRVSFFDILK